MCPLALCKPVHGSSVVGCCLALLQVRKYNYGMTSAFENEANHKKTMKTIEIIRNRNQIVVTELLIRLPEWPDSECFGSIAMEARPLLEVGINIAKHSIA